MRNRKNNYLIATAIANKRKSRFFAEDLMVIENDFQRLQSNLLRGLTIILQQAQALQTNHLSNLQSRVTAAQQALAAIDIVKDQDLFVTYNLRPFTVPGDWGFEPCTGYYDTGEMSVEQAPKIVLQNKLSKCRSQLQDTTNLINSKNKEVEQLSKVVDAYTSDRMLGDVDDVTNNYLDYRHELSSLQCTETGLNAEIEIISIALEGDEGSQHPHDFKSASFSIPTTCGYCKSSIWGLSKQGKTCKSCGLSVHSKCELKVPADCGSPGGGKGAKLSHSPSSASTLSAKGSMRSVSTGRKSPSPRQTAEAPLSMSARVVFAFTPTSPFELGVSEGDLVQVIEGDDGSGWIKVGNNRGASGLVPATYIEMTDGDSPTTSDAPATSKKSFGSGIYVRGLYTYQARGPDELSLSEGQTLELSSGPSGGKNYSDEWWEGFDTSGKKGIFPSNYVEDA